MKATSTKSYSRKLSAGAPHYTSEEFVTRVEKEVEYANKEEYIIVSDTLAAQVKALTLRDIEKNSEVLKLTTPSNPIMVEERA